MMCGYFITLSKGRELRITVLWNIALENSFHYDLAEILGTYACMYLPVLKFAIFF